MEKPVSLKKIFQIWWPLAASWLFMGTELPMVSAFMARLENPKINLAAYGGIVFPIALIIEAPIIMLLAASTALSKDWPSYKKMYKFMMWAGGILTIIHFLIAYTPLYYQILIKILGPPEDIVEPARKGLMIMIPWTWTIAYRRFHQGVLIRFGHSKSVGIGTAIRLITNLFILIIGYKIGNIPGIIVGTSGIAFGVISEAVYAGLVSKPVINRQLRQAPLISPPLSWKQYFDFYIPLALTSLLLLLVQPLGSAALSRMPMPLNSLAVWPVLGGFLFMFRSMGFAYNEVVVASLEFQNVIKLLEKFTVILTTLTTVTLLIISVTPLSDLWFLTISGLEPELFKLAKSGLWVALIWPGLDILRNLYQGVIVHSKKTRAVTESVTLFLIISASILYFGIKRGDVTGLFIGLLAFIIGTLVQVIWLYFRSKKRIETLSVEDFQSSARYALDTKT